MVGFKFISNIHSHRASNIDPDARLQKLRGFVTPVQQLWQNSEMSGSISSFGGFCEMLGMTKVRGYLVSRQVNQISDWGSFKLDEEGQAIQRELDERVRVCIFKLPHELL